MPSTSTGRHPMGRDPRHYQIACLGAFLLYGLFRLDFAVTPSLTAVIVGTALLTQYGCTRFWRLGQFDPRSALISALSLCLLLRTHHLGIACAAASITIASKFILRIDGKHVFNPTNFGLVAMMLFSDQVWVSPGQWGSGALLGFFLACLGGLVVHRASRSDVTYAFVGFYLALLVLRSLWLNEPLSIPLHRVQNGALLLFAFFMISDPKTTPDSRPGRILFALLVALGAGFVHFILFRPNGLLWSLAVLAPTVPLINRALPGPTYAWPRRRRAVAGPIAERSFA